MSETDTDVFGLRSDLIDFLAEREFVLYEDFAAIEVDAGNAEIIVAGLNVKWGGAIEAALRLFAAQNVCPVIFYDKASNSVHIRRRNE